MTHLWVRAETRANETRVAVMPEGARALRAAGVRVTVEDSPDRCVPMADYVAAGAEVAGFATWPDAPEDAIVLGLKELPEDGTPLRHRHIMFGHAYKGQPQGRVLLDRFRAGGGTLLDLEYLVDETGRRVAAFGTWAGYAGAAVSLMALGAQPGTAGAVDVYADAAALVDDVRAALGGASPRVLIIGALGRVGSGAAALCREAGAEVTGWDMAETASGGPFPEILDHDVFLNCILAGPETPVFVPAEATATARKLRVIGDIACDPESAFSPIKVYGRATTWAQPVLRVADAPPLDVMAIDNLPSLLPRESSEDFAAQLLPHLRAWQEDADAVWARALSQFEAQKSQIK